jgi:prepilin-type N-terminal cleavage/methylation domain-containing protein
VRQKAFTIVELIIVISVIGILATIALVSYNGVTNRGHDAAVQSDLEAITGLLESYKADVDTPDEFPHDTTALATIGIKATKNSYQTTLPANFIYCVSTDYQAYALVAASKPGNLFMITQDGLEEYTGAPGDFTAGALCPTLGLNFVATGMSAPNTWQSWVGNG